MCYSSQSYDTEERRDFACPLALAATAPNVRCRNPPNVWCPNVQDNVSAAPTANVHALSLLPPTKLYKENCYLGIFLSLLRIFVP